jgi:hypothetical protein
LKLRSTVTYVPENRYFTRAQAPTVNTINLTVNTLEGDIRLYFTNDDSQICHIAFIKEYGLVTVGRGSSYHSKSNYDAEPASGFNYSIENSQANITASSYSTLVNITLSQNLKYNLNFFTYFGVISINVPSGVNSIQSTNATSRWGYVQTLQELFYLGGGPRFGNVSECSFPAEAQFSLGSSEIMIVIA